MSEKKYYGANIWFKWMSFPSEKDMAPETYQLANGEIHTSTDKHYHLINNKLYPINDLRDGMGIIQYPLHIYTTEERAEDFMTYLEGQNFNYWRFPDYDVLNNDISTYAATIIYYYDNYFREFVQMINDSPFYHPYNNYVQTIKDCVRGKDDEYAIENIVHILRAAGGYTIEFWDDGKETPYPGYIVIDDEPDREDEEELKFSKKQ